MRSNPVPSPPRCRAHRRGARRDKRSQRGRICFQSAIGAGNRSAAGRRWIYQDGSSSYARVGTGQPDRSVTVANRLSASLFLSIHHDSVPDKFLENWEYEGQPSHFSDRFKGHSLFVSFENPNLKSSFLFARLLGGQLKDRGLQYARQYAEEFMGRRRRELLDAVTGVYRSADRLERHPDAGHPA